MAEKGSIVKTKVTVENNLGLHARPASKFVEIAKKYSSQVLVRKDGEEVNGKSIMGLLTLGAAKGSRLIIEAEGVDAAEVIDALRQLVDGRFGED